jgi:excinuclease ABC subunit A
MSLKQKFIEIKGARMHNLKNMDVKIPHNKFTVITGLSGSGKSSLAFDTLYAEGQRRYIESLSAYARQFLGKLNKPEVDYIKGISPAIAIEQKVTSTNPRSTVGTTTEIYNYLKLLFTRIGKTYSPISGNLVVKHGVTDVMNALKGLPSGTRAMVVCPLAGIEKYGIERQLNLLKEQGYTRILVDNEALEVEEALTGDFNNYLHAKLLIDRITTNFEEPDSEARISDSVSLAFAEGNGVCEIHLPQEDKILSFSNRFELDGMEFQEPSEHFFTFNNPFGACKKCEGFGQVLGIDPDLVIPNVSLSVFEGAVAIWRTESMQEYLNELIYNASKFNFPIHRPVGELTEEEIELLWDGNQYFKGIHKTFKFIESKSYKIHYRVMLSRYRGRTTCSDCKGVRLRKDANFVKIDGKSISDIVQMPITKSAAFFDQLKLDDYDNQVSKRLMPEITSRLSFLQEVGLGYLTLNRPSNSLSGGESQRINLATSLGSSLVGSMYILDEPSIGLHPRDTHRLIKVLHKLRDLGNTVIVVEHEEEMMKAADEILDIGPEAGVYGGEVVFHGDYKSLTKKSKSLTAQYLTEKLSIPVPSKRRVLRNKITLTGARLNNLKNVTISIPLNGMVCVSGVSGSGKSTLIKSLLFPALSRALADSSESNPFVQISGDLKLLKLVEFIDQNPIGKSSRSNPVTYVKAFDDIRELFSRQQAAKIRGYKPGFFSFNVDGGRCEMCEGEGSITVGMQFMADVHLTCDTCHGSRYKDETLEVLYREKSIADVLAMDIETALTFFKEGKDRLEQKIVDKIQPLFDVGLGYVQLGQASSTLSGGEAQRIKLASFLAKGVTKNPTLFMFDEPTTGLHFHDINKLLIAFNALIAIGHSVLIIEHNVDVIKCADHVIDIGPEGGEAGGNIVFEGTPEDLAKQKGNYTGLYLKEKLNSN